MHYYDEVNGHVVLTHRSPELQGNNFLKSMVIDEETKVCKSCLMSGTFLDKNRCRYANLLPYYNELDEAMWRVNNIETKVDDITV